MQHRAVRSDSAKSEPGYQQSHVLDAGVREESLQVALSYDESRRDQQREKSEADQNRLDEWAESGRHRHLRDSRDSKKCAARQCARHEAAHQTWRFAVRI